MDLGPFLRARLDEEEQAFAQSRNAELGLAEHLAHWARGRLIRDLEVKRKILDHCVGVVYDGAAVQGDDIAASAGLALEVLCVMAVPYQDHPDYQDAWRPDDTDG